MSTEQKKIIREQVIRRRSLLSNEERKEKELRILKYFMDLDVISKYQTFMVYSSFGSEINTWPIINYLYQYTNQIIFPKVDPISKQLKLYLVNNKNHLTPGIWNILEPDEQQCEPIAIESVNFILVPGLAFDKDGYRIGYGGGYYDKLLAQHSCHAYKVAISFDCQMINNVPKESFDQPINVLITEEQVYYFQR
ncbi:5-formyltetrahydrofolate cyclo-ligase [Ferrovum sp. PN-J185]|uniref:5-formyltetrahydrofolate cyclo-ligase n=1 Tax=Ferrovum sp. PN-J185 TaxID=1356306 RepID=UPI001E5A9D3D|nr:5-formyltetrahydrofolate cyclo-ligase [Ferrovum sp. PN-J185]MCC6069289.1 5-formyltetrahydrofolate cyclo-ligase [Ferrovum sp. PN-J185]MDE1891411.1 5-formyltetrahydrofolate cyclo-ligase [Betaproteobacteria bacterium]MDE2056063.1 5-formyltetrahydrofolate cyclo-ligase [Betaproteobacteria bacterium]